MNFVKMHGLGNDYIYIDCTKNDINFNVKSLAPKLCDRHFGIGSDGIILICNSEIADFKMLMFNADGSKSKMCGNGIRCVGKYIYDNTIIKKEVLKIETLSGIKTLFLKVKNNTIDYITVDMGEPILKPNLIPVISKDLEVKNLELKIIDKTFIFTCVSMGNPHAITIVDNVDNLDVIKYGKIIENNPIFPEKTNVEFIQIINKNNIKIRVYERGTGETLSCGTGACASVVACVINNLTNRNVKVELLGGNLDILFNKEDNHVYMTGTANTCYYGTFNISDYI
jgi:diaminopimelate epimerase